jgi:hypothetical protein
VSVPTLGPPLQGSVGKATKALNPIPVGKRTFLPPVTGPVIESVFESRALNANVAIVVELSDQITFRLPVPVFMWQGSLGIVFVTTRLSVKAPQGSLGMQFVPEPAPPKV